MKSFLLAAESTRAFMKCSFATPSLCRTQRVRRDREGVAVRVRVVREGTEGRDAITPSITFLGAAQ